MFFGTIDERGRREVLMHETQQRQRIAALALLAATALLGLVACGDGGDDKAASTAARPSPAATNEATRAATATATPGPATVLTPTPVRSVPASGADKAYVKDLCLATQDFVDGVAKKISTDASLTVDNTQLLTAFGPLIQDFTDKAGALKPPTDWKPDHDRLIATSRDLLAKIRSGEVKSFQQFTQVFAGTGTTKPLNAEAWKRLDGVIGVTAECSTVGFIFGGL